MKRFIDSLRELLLPTLSLTILATLWVLAKARNGEEDLARGMAAPVPLVLLDRANAAADDAVDEKPEQFTAQAHTTSAADQR